MKRLKVTLFLVLCASGVTLNAAEAVGVVIRVLGTVTYETEGDTREVEPGMEIRKGTRFSGTLGDALDVATSDGVLTIGAFPYVINSPELSRSELDAYLNVIGGAAVRTRSQGSAGSTDSIPRDVSAADPGGSSNYSDLEEITGWPIGSLDIRRINSGFSLEFQPSDEHGEDLLSEDSLVVPLATESEIVRIRYRTAFSESAERPELQVDWTELDSGLLENAQGRWGFSFPDFEIDSITNGRYINRTIFEVAYRDGHKDIIRMHYRISEEAIMEYIDSFADTTGEDGSTPFSTGILKASKYQYNGYMVEALLILQELGLDFSSLQPE